MLSLRCACGQIHAELADPHLGERLVCYCDDCRAFARWLGDPALLDAHGGVDILQVAPAKLRFTQGFEQVRIVRLTPKGLLRSWAGCCRTPIGNLMARPRVPFIGVAVPFVAPEARAALPASSGGIQGRFAVGGCPPGVHPSAPVGLLARTGWRLLGRALRGEHRPSPFFDGSQLTIAPEVLTEEVRAALYS